MNYFFTISIFVMTALTEVFGARISVDSLDDFNEAIAKSGNTIRLMPGEYDLKDFSGRKRVIDFSGSDNKIDLRGVYVNATVGLVNYSYVTITGDNNSILGGEIEDTYSNGMQRVEDFSVYNKDKRNQAYGLRGAAVISILGQHNTVKSLKLTVRGSWPYGYGSFYGIGAHNTFGLNKRCGIVIKELGNTLDDVEVQMRAFGHGIYMQGDADKTVIKNCLVEGRLRKTAELYEEVDPEDLPMRTNYYFPNQRDYKMSSSGKYPIPKDKVHALSEDGIRMYDIRGSVTVENCTVKKMRGGIRLYLGGPATVKDCTVYYCEYTGYNLPKGGKLTESEGDFNFGPLSDYRMRRSSTKAEFTILRSPHAIGDHNLMDIQGNNHRITLKRKPGDLDKKEERAIHVTGNDSTIINKTEYGIVLAEGTKGNKVTSYGPVTDHGDNEVEKGGR